MRNWLVAAVIATASAFSIGQVPDALLEACNAVPDPAKRLECLKQAMARPATAQPPGYEPVRRAFVGLQGSLEVGISLVNYRTALQEIGRELAVYERDAPPQAARGIEKLKDALETYSDAGRFWETSISFYARRDNSLAYFGGLPMAFVGLDWMIGKHGLPTRSADLLGLNVGVPTDLGRTVMWTKARGQAEEGLALLKAPPPTQIEIAKPAKAAAPRTAAAGITVSPTFTGGLKIEDLAASAPEGLKLGDLILGVGGSRIFTAEDFQEAIAKFTAESKPTLVLLQRDSAQLEITLQPARN